MNATGIAHVLPGSIRYGKGFLVRCPCPSHGKGRGDRRPSLSIADGDNGRLLVRCFAGCDASDVLAELRKLNLLNAWREPAKPRWKPPVESSPDPEPDAKAVSLWRNAEPVSGTPGEFYLHARGITIELPHSIPPLPTVTALVAKRQ